MTCGHFNIQMMHHLIHQFFVAYGYLQQTKDIENVLAGVNSCANFMPEISIVMHRKLGKSRLENSALNP